MRFIRIWYAYIKKFKLSGHVAVMCVCYPFVSLFVLTFCLFTQHVSLMCC
jgi:hypothetical protein